MFLIIGKFVCVFILLRFRIVDLFVIIVINLLLMVYLCVNLWFWVIIKFNFVILGVYILVKLWWFNIVFVVLRFSILIFFWWIVRIFFNILLFFFMGCFFFIWWSKGLNNCYCCLNFCFFIYLWSICLFYFGKLSLIVIFCNGIL